jgi:hypothetical protein
VVGQAFWFLQCFPALQLHAGFLFWWPKPNRPRPLLQPFFFSPSGSSLSLAGWARGLAFGCHRSLRERRTADEKYNKSFVTAKLFESEIADLKRRMGLSKEIRKK